jgi:hypothetical protein
MINHHMFQYMTSLTPYIDMIHESIKDRVLDFIIMFSFILVMVMSFKSFKLRIKIKSELPNALYECMLRTIRSWNRHSFCTCTSIPVWELINPSSR